MMDQNVLMVGLSTYDLTVPLDGPLIEDRKYRVQISEEGGGGPAFNAAYLCAKWGLTTYLRSKMGEDAYGDAMRKIMREAGMREDELLVRPEYYTSHSFIYTNAADGKRTIMNFRMDPLDASPAFPAHEIGVILVDGHEPALSLYAFRQYPDAIRVADAGTAREDTVLLAREVDHLVASRVFAEGYTGKELDLSDAASLEEIFSKVEALNKKVLVITLGEDGLLYREEGDRGPICHMEAFPAAAIDTNGAGDIFHGAYVYGLATGMPFREILRFASMTAAVSTERAGSQSAIPTLGEVNARLAAHAK